MSFDSEHNKKIVKKLKSLKTGARVTIEYMEITSGKNEFPVRIKATVGVFWKVTNQHVYLRDISWRTVILDKSSILSVKESDVQCSGLTKR